MPHSLPPITITSIIDVLLVATLIYQGILIVRGRRAAHILMGILVLVLTYLGAVYARLDLLRSLLETLAPYTAFALIVMFQSEIRRGLAQLGRREWFTFGRNLQRREVLEEMILAIQQLAQAKTGALIIFEREIGLRTFIESGVPLEAQVSRDLLLTIFEKGSALHDGAAIVQGERVAAAACFLPLTMKPVSRHLGTRHRAGIGITEEADCLSVIVSEERGEVSLAEHGEIESNVTQDRLHDALSEVLGLSVKKRPPQGRANIRRTVES